ncbi:hypothetical protein BDF14DRAFT_1816667 [Spinellus fusiger]|nr:hypothetical protein BDF14DRAFT_1816667 [Spinellus fusiger]
MKKHISTDQVFETLIVECSFVVPDIAEENRPKHLIMKELASLLKLLYSIEQPTVVLENRLINIIIASLIKVFGQYSKAGAIPPNDMSELWLECILFMLSKTQWKQMISVLSQRELLSLYSSCIQNINTVEKSPSEEIQHLSIQCVMYLLPVAYRESHIVTHTTNPLVTAFQESHYQPCISHCIQSLLHVIVTRTSNMDLRLDAIKAISQLLLDNIGESDIIASYFPGLVSNLRRTLYQRQEKENQRIIVATLDLLGSIIQCVMGDEANPTCLHVLSSMQDLYSVGIASQYFAKDRKEENVSNDISTRINGVNTVFSRTEAWHTSTKIALRGMLESIYSIKRHSEWRARVALVHFSTQLLSTCARSLENCVDLIAESLAMHCEDAFEQVAIPCQQAIHALSQTPVYLDTIVPIMKKGLYNGLSVLPRTIMYGEESAQTNAMDLVIGYILLLGNEAENTLDMALHKHAESWLASFAMDKDSVRVLEEQIQERYIELQESRWQKTVYPKIRFQYLVTDTAAARMTRMLHVIGQHANLKHWVDFFMQHLSVEMTDKESQPQASFVIYSLLEGAELEEDDILYIEDTAQKDSLKDIALHLLHDIINIFIDTTADRASKAVVREQKDILDTETLVILTTCFELKIIGLAASILKQEIIQEELITLLYPLLAHLGSPNIFLHTYALITLDTIASVCHEKNARALSIANIDYVINMVSQRITMLSSNPRAPLVLKALVRIGGMVSVGYLGDSVEEIYDALDRYCQDEWLCSQLCSVLFEIMQVFDGHIRPLEITADSKESPNVQMGGLSDAIKEFIKQTKEEEKEKLEDDVATLEEIGRYFIDQQEKKVNQTPKLQEILQEEMVKEEMKKQQDPSDSEELPEPVESVALSKEHCMALSIMTKAGNMLTSPSRHLRSQVLSLLTCGVHVLAEKTKQLDPLVYKLWPFIVKRLEDDHSVAFCAIELIQTLTKTSGEFISKRVIKDIWPGLKSLIVQSTHSSALPSYSSFSYTHRIQSSILVTLAHIGQHVPLPHTTMLDILETTQCFMSEKTHADLQQQVVDLYVILGDHYADSVWFSCFAMLGKGAILEPQDKRLSPCKVPHHLSTSTQEFKQNAERVLAILH